MENNLQKEFICYIKGKIKIQFIFYLIKICANSALDVFLLSKYSFFVFYGAPYKSVPTQSKPKKKCPRLSPAHFSFCSGVTAWYFFTNRNQHWKNTKVIHLFCVGKQKLLFKMEYGSSYEPFNSGASEMMFSVLCTGSKGYILLLKVLPHLFLVCM